MTNSSSLREQDFLNAVLENAGALVLVMDQEGRIRRFNRACENLSGYSFAEVEGKRPWDLMLPPEDAENFRVNVFLSLRSNPKATASHSTNSWLSKNGERYLLEWSNTVLLDDKDNVEFVISVGTDITSRRIAEKQLLPKNAAIEHALNAIAMADLEGKITYINPAFLKMWGYETDSAVLGRSAVEFWSSPESAAAIITALQQFGQWTGALEAHKANGETFIAEMMAVMICDSAGKPLHMLASFLDISQRIAAEERYQSVVAAMTEGIVVQQADGQIVANNTAAEDILGLSADQMRGRTAMDPRWHSVHEDGAPFPGDEHPGTVALRTGQSFNNVIMGVDHPNKGRRWISINAHPLLTPATRKPYGSLATFTDITERKAAEDALRASNQIIAALLDTTPVLIAYLDTEMNFIRVNRAYAEADGKQPDFFVGKNHFKLYPHTENEVIFRQVANTGQAYTATAKPFEYEHNPERGVSHWDWTLTPVKDAGDKVTGLVLSLLDVTNRVEALEAAQRSEQKLKALTETLETRVQKRTVEVQQQAQRNTTILNTTLDGFFSADNEGRILSANPAFCIMLGYSEAEIVQLNIADIEAKESPSDVSAHIKKLIAQGSDRFDTRHRRKDGSIIDIEISTSSLEIGGEKLFYAFARDITPRKQSEALLREAKENAERANLAKSEFLSRMSHELRTPMNAILGFAQVLEVSSLDQELLEFVAEIHRAGDHLLELINDLLDLARIEAGKMLTVVKPVSVTTIVSEAMQIVQPLLQEKTTTLHNNCGGNCMVLADATRLRQILVNLLSNAVKYNSEDGRVTIECHPVQNQQLRISIIDTGTGILPEMLPQLYTPFERLGAEYGSIEGSGIGLALSRQLAELMNGKLDVESTPGHGSTFWIELPLAETDPSLIDTLTNQKDHLSSAVKKRSHTVLYIEDNAANLRLFEAIFRHQQHLSLISASNGGYGLELATQYQPDLILLDIHLLDMDGYEILHRLKQNPKTQYIPVIAVSADAMPIDIERGLKAGFIEYLTKPINVDALTTAINKTLKLDNLD